MRDQLIIQLSARDSVDDVTWVRVTQAIEHPMIERGSLADAAKASLGAQVIVLTPGQDVLLTTASIPTQNKQRMLKAVPYALEEDIAGDIEDLHFALGKQNDKNQLVVAVVNRALMAIWQSQFRDAGLVVDKLISNVTLLPREDNTWSLFLQSSLAIIRTGTSEGFVADVENLGVILPMLLKQHEEETPAKIHVWRDNTSSSITAWVSDEIEVTYEQCEEGLLGLIARTKPDFDLSINLLQGDFSHKEQLSKLWRPWRMAASFAAALFILKLSVAVVESSQLEQESLALKEQAEQIYKSVFPEAKKVVKPKAQMEQKLKEMRGGEDKSQVTFLTLLSNSGNAFKQTNGLNLRSVRYKNNTLDVELEVPNLQTLDDLKQNLAKDESVTVEIQSAASREDKVQGRIQIKSKAS